MPRPPPPAAALMITGKPVVFTKSNAASGDTMAAPAWNRRDSRCRFLGGDLVAHQADGVGGRSYEDEPRRLDRGGKLGIFGKKSIAWMEGVGARCFCRDKNRVAGKI
jgi:hypothetical protein